MSKGLLSCLAFFLAAGLAGAQPPEGSLPTPDQAVDEPEPPAVVAPAAAGEASILPGSDSAVCTSERFWLRAEYLLWWAKDPRFPQLVTAGSPTDSVPGAQGQPGTAVLFGGGSVDEHERSGGRFTFGTWMDDSHTWGVEADYLFLGARDVNYAIVSTGSSGPAVLARPFFDVLGNQPDASLTAYPGLATGSVSVSSHSFLQGAEANLVGCLWHGDNYRIEALVGFRFLNLDETLDVGEADAVSANSPVLTGNHVVVFDHFGTRDYFYGPQAGVRGTFSWEHWNLEVVAKVALGDTHEVADVFGTTTLTAPGAASQVSSGGLLALPSNSGTFSRDGFAVVPEAGITLSYRLTSHLSTSLGYSFLYWSQVARAGDQVDLSINRHQVPTSIIAGPLTGPARPAFAFSTTDYWVQGLNFGLEYRW